MHRIVLKISPKLNEIDYSFIPEYRLYLDAHMVYIDDELSDSNSKLISKEIAFRAIEHYKMDKKNQSYDIHYIFESYITDEIVESDFRKQKYGKGYFWLLYKKFKRNLIIQSIK